MTQPIVRRPAAWLLGTALAGVVLWATSGLAVAQDKAKPEASTKTTKATQAAKAPPVTKAQRPKPTNVPARKKGKGFQGPPRPGSRGLKGQSPRKAAPRGKGIPKPTVVLKPGEVPAIKFDVPVYDFGRVRAGEDVIHDFWFTNTGTGPLEILRVKPG